jgi:hypothetical protein
VVNLALKSGANAFHGAFGYFNRNDSRTATPFLTERAGDEKPTRSYNRWRTVSARSARKTFFMVSYEHLRDVQPEPATYTVPTMLMRRGTGVQHPSSIRSPPPGAQPARALPATSSRSLINHAAAYVAYYPEPKRPAPRTTTSL